jgi:hypothetical protein
VFRFLLQPFAAINMSSFYKIFFGNYKGHFEVQRCGDLHSLYETTPFKVTKSVLVDIKASGCVIWAEILISIFSCSVSM